jgi:methionine biosynthesis protein MetW
MQRVPFVGMKVEKAFLVNRLPVRIQFFQQTRQFMKALRRYYRELTRPAPLNNFEDYDAYWERRLYNLDLPPVLPRHQIIADQIPNGSSVLDIGCGDGAFLRYLRDAKPDCRIVGADVSETAVAHVGSQGFEVIHIGNGRPLNQIVGEQFDFVVLMEVIEHVHDAETLARQAASLARKRLFFTLPNVGFILHRVRLGLFGRFPVTSIIYHMREHIRFWTVKDFSEWLDSLNLTLRRTYPQVSRSENYLVRMLATRWPGLFSAQVIYEVAPTELAINKTGSQAAT